MDDYVTANKTACNGLTVCVLFADVSSIVLYKMEWNIFFNVLSRHMAAIKWQRKLKVLFYEAVP